MAKISSVVEITVFLVVAMAVVILYAYSGNPGGAAEQNRAEDKAEQTTITLADIAKHNTAQGCWTAVNGKAYDITGFISSHTGGIAITQACGRDGTELFEDRNGRGPHPDTSMAKLGLYYIGNITA